MGKILYPVGTRVLLKNDIGDEDPLYVVQYRKGKDFPYGLSSNPDGKPEEIENSAGTKGHKWFSVKGLKRYTPNEQKKSAERPAGDVEAPKLKAAPQCDMSNYYTKEEVQRLLQETACEMMNYTEVSIREVESELLGLARITDHNFRTVSKNLSHNDD